MGQVSRCTEHQLPIDQGWAWVVLMASTIAYSVMPFQAMGVLMVEVAERYEGVYEPPSLIWVFTLVYILYGISGPLAGILLEKFSHRAVMFLGILLIAASFVGLAFSTSILEMIGLFSIPSGVGSGMVFLSAISICNKYFEKKKIFALGVVTGASSAFGCIVHPYIYRILFDNWSYRESCLMFSGFILQTLIPVCLVRPMPNYVQRTCSRCCQPEELFIGPKLKKDMNMDQDSGITKDLTSSNSSSDSTLRSVNSLHRSVVHVVGSTYFVETESNDTFSIYEQSDDGREKFNWRLILFPKYLFVGTSVFVFTLGLSVSFFVLPALGNEAGIPKTTIAMALGASGSLQIFNKIFSGILADRNIVKSSTQLAIVVLMTGLLFLTCASVLGLTGLITGLIGLYGAGTTTYSLAPATYKELLGTKNLTSAMSGHMVFEFIGSLAAAYITGAVYEAYGSWRIVTYYISAMMLLASCIIWPYCLYNWYREYSRGKINTSGIEVVSETYDTSVVEHT